MKIQRKLLVAAALLAGLSSLPLAAQPASTPTTTPAPPPAQTSERPSILILGTVHLSGETSDLMSPTVPDILGAKHQREMVEMVEALKRYQPTKIAIEATPESIGKVNERYQAFLKGEYKLKADEIDQIAFRLAKALGQSRLYPADSKLDMDFDGVMGAAAKNGQQPIVDQAMQSGQAVVAEIGQHLKTGSLGQIYRYLNAPETLAAGHRPYLYFAQIGTAADPKGAEMIAGWYRRNLLIYGNLVRLLDSPRERLFLLIGQGHAKLLSEYIAESPNLRLAEPAKYLP